MTEGAALLLSRLPRPSDVARRLAERHGLTACVGFELELYAHPAPARPGELAAELTAEVGAGEPLFLLLEGETGPGQLEVATRPVHDPDAAVCALARLREGLERALARRGLAADWRSFPSPGLPGSALHVHLSLHDRDRRNVFRRGDGGEESPTLLRVLAGMLDTLPDLMPVFAPTEACYGRYVEVPFPGVAFSPSRACWGPDNRAAALRLPPCGAAPDARRIEHRVAGAGADPAAVLAAVLAGACVGLERAVAPRHGPTFGHPGHPLHDLPRLPGSLAEARVAFALRGRALLASFLAGPSPAADLDGPVPAQGCPIRSSFTPAPAPPPPPRAPRPRRA